VLTVLLCGGTLGFIFLRSAKGFSAREKPSSVEVWVARTARSVAIPSNAKARINPVPKSEEMLNDARAHWADDCASCHANNGSGETQIGRNLYPPAPDMRKEQTQQMSDGELFYIIENGIRLSGMPAWASGHGEEDSWKLVHFIRHLPQLSFSEEKEMEKLNPKSPAETKEEKEEEKFLKETTVMKQNLHTITKAIAAWAVALTVILAGVNILATTAGAHEGMEHITGIVTSTSENSLSVKTTKGATVEVRLDAKTQYAQGKQPAKLSDIKTGTRVVVHAMKMNGALVAHEVSIGVNKSVTTPTKKAAK
jgi:mono/diheme cytochrome c family protein